MCDKFTKDTGTKIMHRQRETERQTEMERDSDCTRVYTTVCGRDLEVLCYVCVYACAYDCDKHTDINNIHHTKSICSIPSLSSQSKTKKHTINRSDIAHITGNANLIHHIAQGLSSSAITLHSKHSSTNTKVKVTTNTSHYQRNLQLAIRYLSNTLAT